MEKANTLRSENDLIPTRWSLVTRLKNWDDQEGWKEFFDTYWKLIYAVALKSGLSDEEAQEVVQETVITVARSIKKLKSDPTRGSFKGWLLKTTQWRIADQFKKRRPDQKARFHHYHRNGETSQTGTLDRLPHPHWEEMNHLWDQEWERNLIDVALERIKRQVQGKHYQIFFLHVIRHQPARRVAKAMGISIAHLYVIKHRLGRLLKAELKKLKNDLS